MTLSSIVFTPDGGLSGLGGYNRHTGTWNAECVELSTRPVAQTRKACVPSLGRQETAFLEILGASGEFQLTPTGALVVSDEGGRTITARRQVE